MKRFKQKAACIVLTLIFTFSLMPAFSDHASAYEVPDESLQNMYRIVAFNSYLLGNQTYFDTDTNARRMPWSISTSFFICEATARNGIMPKQSMTAFGTFLTANSPNSWTNSLPITVI